MIMSRDLVASTPSRTSMGCNLLDGDDVKYVGT